LAFPLIGSGLSLHVDQDRHAKRRPGFFRGIRIIGVVSSGLFLPGDDAPHIAIALCDANVGDAVGHPPIAGRVNRHGRRGTRSQHDDGEDRLARDVSWAMQHGLNLCLR
jgi:hypothetical protein